MENKLFFIINPVSGTKDKEHIIDNITDFLESKNIGYIIKFTEYSRHTTEIARDAIKHGYDKIIAVGGDGTINEVAAALTGHKAVLGIIPCGSGNGLARNLLLPLNPIKALEVILQNNIKRIDYCTVNGMKYFCAFGVGYDAVVAHTFAEQKNRGLNNYILSAVKEYGHYLPHEYTIHFNGTEISEQFMLIAACNGSQYGNNAYIAPEAVNDDGNVDLVMIRPGSHLTRFMATIKMFTHNIKENKNIVYRSVSELTITDNNSEQVLAHLDGEPIIINNPIKIKCHKQQLSVFVPLS